MFDLKLPNLQFDYNSINSSTVERFNDSSAIGWGKSAGRSSRR